MSPPVHSRLVCPGLNLAPAETPSDLFASELAFFKSIPWTAARLSAPGAIAFVPPCRNPITDVHDQFFGRTLANDRSLTHMLCVFRTESTEAALDPAQTVTQMETLICTGDGVSGFPNVVHGGVVASLLDESMGAFFDLNITLGKSASAFQASNVTGKLDVSYLKPAPTNSVLRITVKAEEMNGRKTKFHCELKDENDLVVAKCSSLWVTVKPSL
ncbi:HotDog domain-containing protein [Dactylonectria estremocensis]|uniref:HotDog domain-containing protein n=1 Tax=Dactylonectria estremocensis TaxID=1079267 RepID=A0A9P9F270_9HYPO|nr:HotDog domain-containing protein [Dactylonectria estremocensis]